MISRMPLSIFFLVQGAPLAGARTRLRKIVTAGRCCVDRHGPCEQNTYVVRLRERRDSNLRGRNRLSSDPVAGSINALR